MNRNRLTLWIAQGFGIGRIPLAPGTFGSLLGFGWLKLLLLTGSAFWVVAGILAGFGLSVWSSGEAERILGKTDPSSVVIDEITAVPCCFLGWILILHQSSGSWSQLPSFPSFWFCGLVFAGFRFFDIWKPWPVGRSQNLPGGWGITVDDFLAAGYVNILTLVANHLFKVH